MRGGWLAPPLAVALWVSASWVEPAAAPPSDGAEWRHWGGSAGGVRFSPLDQINRDNVARLAPAWTYDTGELKLGRDAPSFKSNFATTPLVVKGLLYLSTPSSRVIALDPETGKEVWTFDPQAGKSKREFNAHRGVSYWEGASSTGKPCEARILGGTVDGRLFALDAATGALCSGFGRDGYVDLRAEDGNHWVERASWGGIRITAPPAVYKDVLITGCAQEEYPGRGPSGDVRAYDVRTGRMAWRFHVVPHPGEVGHETWEGDSWKDRMGANVWSMMSVDLERGIVFLPTGSPASDFYGGDRKGDDLFGNSLVALDAATGKRLWHFQVVHHDLWDYDVPAQPVLVTVRRDGKDVAAVAQVTKTGFVYVLDRVTGAPLFPIEERPVPASDIPGEKTAATQPFPTKPPALSRQQALTRDELSQVTPQSRSYCEKLFDTSVSGGMFTPLTTKPTIFFPGLHGGGNWGGGAYDPTSGLLYVGANEVAGFGYLKAARPRAPLPYTLSTVLSDIWFTDPNGWPCQQPPWGTLNAVEVSSGEIRWRVPLGSVDELEAKGVPKTGRQSLGGAIATAGGLVFIGATVDQRFRAFDAKTGEELWSFRLPANAHANPMTFRGKSGRQYVVIAAGGGGFWRDLSRVLSDSLIAFALPATSGYVPTGRLDPARVNVLAAADAARSAGLSLATPITHIKAEVVGWTRPDQSLRWTIEAPATEDYAVSVVMGQMSGPALDVRVSADETSVASSFKPDPRGSYSRSSLDPPLRLTQGRHSVTLRLAPHGEAQPFGAEVLALELVRPSVRDAQHAEALALRADARWMPKGGLGVMFHWTKRTMPRSGPQKSYDEAADAFDVERFAGQVASTGAGFVVLTTAHSDQYIPAPIKALDAVLPGRTTKRDLIGDLIAALGKRGIRLVLYYHIGPIEDPEWARATGLWESDSDRLFCHWEAIVGEVGERYGDKLAGWWFDDGIYNYAYRSPDWSALDRVAKRGNPNRVVCFNSWKSTSATEFQDFHCGEELVPDGANAFLNRDGSFGGTLKAGGDGRIVSGAFAGLQAVSTFVLENDWFHIAPDTEAAPPKRSPEELAKVIRMLHAYGATPIVNMLIYQDGEIAPKSLESMRETRAILERERGTGGAGAPER